MALAKGCITCFENVIYVKNFEEHSALYSFNFLDNFLHLDVQHRQHTTKTTQAFLYHHHHNIVMNFTLDMDPIVYSQQHLNPLPRHYQGNDPKEFAYQCFVDWKDEHPYRELSEFLVVIQAVNHAAHWLQADIMEHIKLQATLRALNTAILAKRKLPEYTQKLFSEYTQSRYPRPTQRLTLISQENYFQEIATAASQQHNTHILTLRTSLAATKTRIRAIKEERFRSPLLELIYRTILGDNKLLHAECPTSNNLSTLRILAWALENLSCAIYLAIEEINASYMADMCRLSRALAPRVARLVEKLRIELSQGESHLLASGAFVQKMVSAQALLTRFVEGHEEEEDRGQDDEDEKYLTQIVKYWSRWDRDGYAQRDFKAVWSLVSRRECIVWQR